MISDKLKSLRKLLLNIRFKAIDRKQINDLAQIMSCGR